MFSGGHLDAAHAMLYASTSIYLYSTGFQAFSFLEATFSRAFSDRQSYTFRCESLFFERDECFEEKAVLTYLSSLRGFLTRLEHLLDQGHNSLSIHSRVEILAFLTHLVPCSFSVIFSNVSALFWMLLSRETRWPVYNKHTYV